MKTYVLDLLRAHTGKFLVSFLCYLVKHSPVWILPVYTSALINIILDSGFSGLQGFLVPTILFVLLFLLNIPFQVLHIRFFSRASRSIEMELRRSLIRKLQELSISFYAKTRSGSLTAKFLRDVEAIEMALKQVTMGLLPAIVSFIYVMIVTSMRQPLVSLFFLVAIPLLWLVRFVFASRMRSQNTRYRKDMENLSAKVNESIEMLPVARAHALEETEIVNIETYFEKINKSGLELDVYNAAFGSTTWVLLQLCTLGALVFSGFLAATGRIPAGDIVLYQGFFAIISNALSAVFNVMPILYKGRESFRSVSEILNAPDLEMNHGKPVFSRVEGEFTMEGLRFKYPGALVDALNIDYLHIPQGQMLGIVGASGSGKSSFINMIIGFIRPDEGELFLDGAPYRNHDLRSLRKHCSVVGQSPILFTGSVKANISYGDSEGKDEDIIEALKAANAWEFVSELPHGLHEMVGEHGATLSGGQRQRLVLARAFYRNPRILFFDEATSALDSESEARVQAAMENIARDRTSFVVAHRLSTVLNTDRVLVFDKGRIVQDDSTQNLLKVKGVFRSMAARQGLA